MMGTEAHHPPILSRFKTVHDGNMDIYQDDVEPLNVRHLDRHGPTSGKSDVEIKRLQYRRDDPLIGEIYLNHKGAAVENIRITNN